MFFRSEKEQIPMNGWPFRHLHMHKVGRNFKILLGAFCIIAIGVGYSLRSIPTLVRLGMISQGDSRSIPFAVRHLESKNVFIRSAAAQGLGQIGPRAKSAVPILLVALHDESPEVSARSAWALGNIDYLSADPNVIAELIASMNHSDPEVRRYSAYALSLYGVRAASATTALASKLDDPHVAPTAARALGEIGSPARASIPNIAALLKSDDIGHRAEGAMALSKLQPLPDDVVLQIKGLLLDPSPLVRECAKKVSEEITSHRMQVGSQQPTTPP